MCTGGLSAASRVACGRCDQPTKQTRVLMSLDRLWYFVLIWTLWERSCDNQFTSLDADPERGAVTSEITRLEKGRAGVSLVLWPSHLWGQVCTERGKSRPHISAQMFLKEEGAREGELTLRIQGPHFSWGFQIPHNPFIRLKNKD